MPRFICGCRGVPAGHKGLGGGFASCALAIAAVFLVVWGPRRRARTSAGGASRPCVIPAVVVPLATVLIARQTMEIGATFGTALFDSGRSKRPGLPHCAGLAALIAAAWLVEGGRAATPSVERHAVVSLSLFGSRCRVRHPRGLEARLLPFADSIHTASEPYGPDDGVADCTSANCSLCR
jgi:hypothetical protein